MTTWVPCCNRHCAELRGKQQARRGKKTEGNRTVALCLQEIISNFKRNNNIAYKKEECRAFTYVTGTTPFGIGDYFKKSRPFVSLAGLLN